jgi:hypothetical protein
MRLLRRKANKLPHRPDEWTNPKKATVVGKRKNPAAVTLAKRRMIAMTPEERRRVALTGAAVGGQARAKKLTPAERKAIVRRARGQVVKKAN